MTRFVLPALLAVLTLAWWGWRWRVSGDWKLGPVLLVVPLLVFAGNQARWWHLERGFTRATEPIIGERDVAFGCERVMRNFFSSHGFRGHVSFDADGTPAQRAFLSMSTCAGVRAFAANPAEADEDQIVAVHILSHEAAHLAGVRNEGHAECLALAHDVPVMQRLGATVEQATAYRARYLAQVYPRLPADYRSDCLASEVSLL